MKRNLVLYFHIPFCKSKCLYCDFNSYSGMESIQDEYIDCLIKEIEMRSSEILNYNIESIYIGGGTPTYLNYNYLAKMLDSISRYASYGIEYTCEANPGTLSTEKLKLLREYGVNRLSIGLQSWDNDILRNLGRIHDVDEFVDNYHSARAEGFKNINVDLMFSIYNQTIENFSSTLDRVVSLNPDHISCYSLIIEEGTPIYERYKSGEYKETDEEVDRDMYCLANKKLEDAGYKHYEISNYAREGYECRHNIIYWRTKEYLGFGAGAHSYVGVCRFSNELSPLKYIEKVKTMNLPVIQKVYLTKIEMMSEYMFMGLRMLKGICTDEFEERFGCSIYSIYGKQITKMINFGLLKKEGRRITLTARGIDISNQVFVEFI